MFASDHEDVAKSALADFAAEIIKRDGKAMFDVSLS
jgi:hypothetical protein